MSSTLYTLTGTDTDPRTFEHGKRWGAPSSSSSPSWTRVPVPVPVFLGLTLQSEILNLKP